MLNRKRPTIRKTTLNILDISAKGVIKFYDALLLFLRSEQISDERERGI